MSTQEGPLLRAIVHGEQRSALGRLLHRPLVGRRGAVTAAAVLGVLGSIMVGGFFLLEKIPWLRELQGLVLVLLLWYAIGLTTARDQLIRVLYSRWMEAEERAAAAGVSSARDPL